MCLRRKLVSWYYIWSFLVLCNFILRYFVFVEKTISWSSWPPLWLVVPGLLLLNLDPPGHQVITPPAFLLLDWTTTPTTSTTTTRPSTMTPQMMMMRLESWGAVGLFVSPMLTWQFSPLKPERQNVWLLEIYILYLVKENTRLWDSDVTIYNTRADRPFLQEQVKEERPVLVQEPSFWQGLGAQGW